MTIKFMEPVSLGEGTKVTANPEVGALRARLDQLEKQLANVQEISRPRTLTALQQPPERTPDDICYRGESIPSHALVSGQKVTRPIRNLTPYHVSVYLNRTPVTILPPCFGPSMIETPPTEFRLEAVATMLTSGGQKQVSLSVVPTETGWDIVTLPGESQASAQ
jgi:hypothetical protein